MNSKSKKVIFKFLTLTFILVAIPLSVYLAKNTVKYLPKADVFTTNIFVISSSTSLNRNETATVTLKVDTQTHKATFLKIFITFDKTKINLASEITPDPRWRLVKKSTLSEANSTGNIEIVLAYPPGTEPLASIYDVANFTIIAVSNQFNDSATLSLNSNLMQVVGDDGLISNLVVTNQNIALNSCAGCLSSSNTCIPLDKQTNELCGVNAAVCTACSTGQACIGGRCVGSTSPAIEPSTTPIPTSSQLINPSATPTPSSPTSCLPFTSPAKIIDWSSTCSQNSTNATVTLTWNCHTDATNYQLVWQVSENSTVTSSSPYLTSNTTLTWPQNLVFDGTKTHAFRVRPKVNATYGVYSDWITLPPTTCPQ